MKLLGISALRLASEFCEPEPLSAELLIASVQKHKITTWHLEEMEVVVSQVIGYEFKAPTPRQFLRIFARASGFDKYGQLFNVARFFIDLALIMNLTKNFAPSLIAVSSLKLALTRMRQHRRWQEIPFEQLESQHDMMGIHSGFAPRDIYLCQRALCEGHKVLLSDKT